MCSIAASIFLGEWAHNNTFDSVEVEKERGVVGEEWRMGLGAFKRIQDKQFPIILAGSQYAVRNTIGLKPVIDTAHQSTIKRFLPRLVSPRSDGRCLSLAISMSIRWSRKSRRSSRRSPIHRMNVPAREFPVPPHADTYVAINTDKEMPITIFSMEFERPGNDEITVADYRNDNLVTGLYEQMLNARIQEAIQKAKHRSRMAGSSGWRFCRTPESLHYFCFAFAGLRSSGHKRQCFNRYIEPKKLGLRLVNSTGRENASQRNGSAVERTRQNQKH